MNLTIPGIRPHASKRADAEGSLQCNIAVPGALGYHKPR